MFVQRDDAGNIIGLFANPQPEIAEEWVEGAALPEAQPVTPGRVTMRQARLALLGAGLLDDVESAVTAMGDTPEGKAARIEWEYGSEVVRESPFVAQLGGALGLTSAQIDELFVTAAGIE